MLRKLSNQNRFRQEPDDSWRPHESCDDKTCWRLVGTAAHRMRGDEAGTKYPAWFKLLCGQVGQLQVPGEEKIRHNKICFGESDYIINSKEVKLLEQARKDRKKFVRYPEGAEIYSLGIQSFMKIAKEAHAVYKIRNIALVNTEILDAYLEAFRE